MCESVLVGRWGVVRWGGVKGGGGGVSLSLLHQCPSDNFIQEGRSAMCCTWVLLEKIRQPLRVSACAQEKDRVIPTNKSPMGWRCEDPGIQGGSIPGCRCSRCRSSCVSTRGWGSPPCPPPGEVPQSPTRVARLQTAHTCDIPLPSVLITCASRDMVNGVYFW